MHNSTGMVQQLLGDQFAWLFRDSVAWTCFGFLGTFLFGSRFVVQWLHSEKHQRIVVPPIFWHLSFWGSLISLVYAVHIDKMPVVFGVIFLPFIYARNLMLLRKNRQNVLGGANG
jgi:lipid-A-disaccharide synthase-like uncharacterized protein